MVLNVKKMFAIGQLKENIIKLVLLQDWNKMKHKIGDMVKIKSIGWYNRNKNEQGIIHIGPGFTSSMSGFCGKKYFIENIFSGVYYTLKGLSSWGFCDEFFEENKLELE